MERDEVTIWLILTVEAADDDELRDVVDRLRRRHYEVEVRVVWEGEQARMFARKAAENGVDALVGCGGDGTLHELVNGVMEVDDPPIVAGLPYGTGNDFLRSLGIGPRPEPSRLETWLDLSPTMIDLGATDDRYFVNMATAGVGAEVTAEVSRQLKDVAGSFAYFVRGIPAAFDLPVRATRIDGPGLDWEGQLAFLFVGNGRQSGGGWTLCPAARLDDGLLDVVIVPDMPIREMARYGREMVKAGTTGDFGPLVYRQVEQLTVEFDGDTPLNLDGEPVEGNRFEFRAVEKALRFLVPPVDG